MNIPIGWQKIVVSGGVAIMLLFLGGLAGWALSRGDTSEQAHSGAAGSADEERITFAAVGDFGASDATSQVLRTIAAAKSDFAIALGDFSYGLTATEEDWCNLVKSEVGPQFPFQLIAGNHDIESVKHAQSQGHVDRFASCLPNRMASMEGTYAHDYFFDKGKLARFILISPDLTINGVTKSYASGTAEYQWLSDRIDEARRAGTKWMIVGMHKNCITLGQKHCEIGADLMTLLVEKRVDLILQGHEHGYMRSKQLSVNANCLQIGEGGFKPACVIQSEGNEVYQQGEGSLLAINGTGGVGLRTVLEDSPGAPFFAAWNALEVNPAYGPLVVTLTDTSMEGRFVSTDGIVKDEFTITSQ